VTKRFVTLAATVCAMLLSPTPAPSAPGTLLEHPCSYAQLPALCGTFRVPEVRSLPKGRTITLHFVRIPAAHGSGAPIFPIAGGPGQSVIAAGAGYVGDGRLSALHPAHDFVFLDQRGTGLSHPLLCNLYPHTRDIFAEIFPLGTVRACRDKLAKTSDLNAYGSDAAADDLDALRKLLGYRKVILIGGSYGTTEALVYLRRHGGTVQSEVLEGVSPPFDKFPLPFLQGAQRAFDDLAASCTLDALCHARFPRFRSEFSSLLKESTAGIPVDFDDAQTHEHVRVKLMRGVFADRMRQAMYSPDVASLLPLIVHEAARGNTTPLSKLVVFLSRAIIGSLAVGENISVDCREAVLFLTDADIARESKGSFMANTIVDARRATCAIWNVRPVERSFLEPIRSAVPVLMMSGQDDPATPPQPGTRELAYLSNGRQILIPNGGHNNDDPCLTQIEIRFVLTSSGAGLNAACAQHFSRPPFVTRLPDFLR
jgi:pimeloyl-ACP methyl ester carboxylesterase